MNSVKDVIASHFSKKEVGTSKYMLGHETGPRAQLKIIPTEIKKIDQRNFHANLFENYGLVSSAGTRGDAWIGVSIYTPFFLRKAHLVKKVAVDEDPSNRTFMYLDCDNINEILWRYEIKILTESITNTIWILEQAEKVTVAPF